MWPGINALLPTSSSFNMGQRLSQTLRKEFLTEKILISQSSIQSTLISFT